MAKAKDLPHGPPASSIAQMLAPAMMAGVNPAVETAFFRWRWSAVYQLGLDLALRGKAPASAGEDLLIAGAIAWARDFADKAWAEERKVPFKPLVGVPGGKAP